MQDSYIDIDAKTLRTDSKLCIQNSNGSGLTADNTNTESIWKQKFGFVDNDDTHCGAYQGSITFQNANKSHSS